MRVPTRFLGVFASDAQALDRVIGRLPPRRQADLEAIAGAGCARLAAAPADASIRALPGSDGSQPRWHIASGAGGTPALFYALAATTGLPCAVIVGSSAMEVLAATASSRKANGGALERYLASGAIAGEPQTLLRNVGMLLPGHRLEIIPGAPARIRQVAHVVAGAAPEPAAVPDRAAQLQRLLLEGVESLARGRATAVALSGGIDSSGILAALRRARDSGPAWAAFAFRQRSPALPAAWDEYPWALRAAEHAGAELHAVEMQAGEIPAALASVAAQQDFPFGSPVILAQAKLFRVAAERGFELILGGHGPDILFGGSDAHLAVRLAGLLRRGRFIAASRMFPGAARHASASGPRLLAAAIRRLMPAASACLKPVPWTSSAWFDARRAPIEPVEEPSGVPDPMQALVLEQLRHSLGATTLLYEEANAAANGLENRQPYLEEAIVRFARSCGADEVVGGNGRTKHILRLALAGLVPDEILARQDRVGFAVPALPWLLEQRDWAGARYGELRSLPFFAGPPARELWARLEAGNGYAWAQAYCLWRWLVLLEWAQAHNVGFE